MNFYELEISSLSDIYKQKLSLFQISVLVFILLMWELFWIYLGKIS